MSCNDLPPARQGLKVHRRRSHAAAAEHPALGAPVAQEGISSCCDWRTFEAEAVDAGAEHGDLETLAPEDTMPALRPGVLVAEVAGEALAYDPVAMRAHRLNPAGARVLRRCDGTSPAEEAARDLAAGTELSPEAAREAVRHHLSRLHRAGLLDPRAPVPARPSRRQFLARWGKAAAVLLPVMASLSAPAAAQIQSCPACINSFNVGCQAFFGAVRLSVCCMCEVGGVCSNPAKVCMTQYTKGAGGGTSCLDEPFLGVTCGVDGAFVGFRLSCTDARAAVPNGAAYFCCQCP